MALKLRVIKPEFLIDVAEATDHQAEDLIPLYGFLGGWRNPTHVLIAADADLWIVPMEDFEEILRDCGSDTPDLDNGSFSVEFAYRGHDQLFLEAMIDRYGLRQPKVAEGNEMKE